MVETSSLKKVQCLQFHPESEEEEEEVVVVVVVERGTAGSD